MLTMEIVACKSTLLSQALRNQAACHKESAGIWQGLQLARPYLFQSMSKVNYLFSDISSVNYISRHKNFNSFLQTLAENILMYPSLIIAHLPGGRHLFSRTLDNHTFMDNPPISKNQALLIPSFKDLKPGAMLTNDELRKLIQHEHKDELFDIIGKENKYIQCIDWSLYNNDDQHYTSEREYLLGGLLASTDPSLALEFPTFKDIFKIKESSG